MPNRTDTIAAIATPPGIGGIGIVRLSGPKAKEALARVFLPVSQAFTTFRPWTLHRGRFMDGQGLAVDDVLAVFMPGPRTFTGEDVAEIHCHGGATILRTVLETLLAMDVRLAERGEFSRRALVNGRMDLTQAEAIAEMITAPTSQSLHTLTSKLGGLLGQKILALRSKLEYVRMALCVAVDFPDDEVECLAPAAFAAAVHDVAAAIDELLRGYARGRCWQEGARAVLGGAVNAGKSSLLNSLLGHARALVTDIPGTTRDFLEEYLVLDGLPLRITDTAGLRESDDTVEQLGIARSRQCLAAADIVLLVLDGAQGADAARGIAQDAAPLLTGQGAPVVLVWNKSDLTPTPHLPPEWEKAAAAVVCISAKEGTGLDELTRTIRRCLLEQSGREPQPDAIVPNLRQATVLRKALDELHLLGADIAGALPYDICAVRLNTVVSLLGEIVGLQTTEEVLNSVFATFCIGK